MQPEAALREGLQGLARTLAERGAAPFHMTAMTWTAPDIEALHPRHHTVDRIYREVFGGFRPPIKLLPDSSRRLVVKTHATVPPARHEQPVWHGLTRPELAAQYSPRNQVPDMLALFGRWTDGALARSFVADNQLPFAARNSIISWRYFRAMARPANAHDAAPQGHDHILGWRHSGRALSL